MADERRYQDDEMRRIFEAASALPEEADTVPGRTLAAPDGGGGFSLAELQDIGREVGLEPDRVAAAAAALDRPASAPAPQRRLLGLPLSAGRTVALPRAPTDEEWEILVSEFRRTFEARGKVSGHGALREWTNGNLHAFVERTEEGHRLRMGTVKGGAVPTALGGAGALLFGIPIALGEFAKGQTADGLIVMLIFVLSGLVMLAGSLGRLPAWARSRQAQMDGLAERAVALLTGSDPASQHADGDA